MVTTEQLFALEEFDSPTLCNAIEWFGIRSRLEGYLAGSVRCMIPRDRPFIGYATTARLTTQPAQSSEEGVAMGDYYRYLQAAPRPGIAVLQDVDSPHRAAMWGDVMAHIHQAVGSRAIVTNGGVRDLKAISAMDFGCFASGTLCSHGYIHMLEYNCPVELDGVTIHPGDLLFCDNEGIVLLPEFIVPQLPSICRKMAAAEWPVLGYVQEALLKGAELDMKILERRLDEMNQLRRS